MSSAFPVLSKRVVASLGALVTSACAQDVFISSGPPDVNPADVTDCGFTLVEGTRSSVTFSRNGDLRVVVDPRQGQAGRPSSSSIIRAVAPRE